MLDNPRVMRTGLLLGEEGVKHLQNSCVMIIGIGAVGGYALEGLARAGIGHFILVDFDIFDETNINRQILALGSTIGRKKIDIAKQRVLDINPHCVVETVDTFVNADTLDEIMSYKVDFVIDAIDALNPKCCLIEALSQKGIPFISSMGAALKTDPSCITLGSLNKTENCGLSKFIRKRLRKRNVDISKIICVSSHEQVNLPETAILSNDTDDSSATRTRNTLGSLPTITAIFGLTIANEVIKRLSK